MSQISKRERFRGAMVGVLCGDALGAPYEWQPPEGIQADLEARGGLIPHEYKPFDYIEPWKKKRLVPKGQPTDDSELAAALAESLVARPEFDAADLYARLRSFIHDRKSILAEVAYGSGGTLRAALTPETYEESRAKFALGEIPTPPSNGSLMRSIAAPLGAFPYFSRVTELARRQSLVTHQNPSAVAACVVYSSYVGFVLSDRSRWRAWEDTITFLRAAPPPLCNVSAQREILELPITKPEYLSEIKGREGWVVLSLRVALWASMSATSFADGILKAVVVGGDTDTYAAIAGGILGAHYGYEAIPKEWRDILQGREKMIELADRLYDHVYA